MRQHLVVIRDRPTDRGAHALDGLALRQLPQAAPQATRRALSEEDRRVLFDPHLRTRQDRQHALARGHDRKLVLSAAALRRAQLRERAGEAARRGRRTDRRAELHEALIEIAGRCVVGQRGHQPAGVRPQRLHTLRRFDVIGDREHAPEHARDIAVDERRPFAIRDRRDRTGGVRPDARHVAQAARGTRQRITDRLRARVQVARARVVAEAGPRGEHVVEWRGCERRHRRKLRHPARPVRNDRRDARLLQHDLADPDRVRVARAPPRQVALHARVMRDDRLCDVTGRVAHPARIPQ